MKVKQTLHPPREMLKTAVLAFLSSQSENAISALLDFSTALAVEKWPGILPGGKRRIVPRFPRWPRRMDLLMRLTSHIAG
jgi:hypothetical protein